MRFDLKVTGDPEEMMLREILAAEIAATKGTRAAGKGLQRAWRQQVREALGYRLAGSIRVRGYPEAGESINAASLVYAPSRRRVLSYARGSGNATASDIIASHDRGAVIRSRDGLFLAIPLGSAANMRGADSTGRGDRTRITPGGWERKTGRRLRFVYRRGEPSLLVDDGSVAPGNVMLWKGGRNHHAKNGGYRSPRAIKRKKVIPIFILVPQVRLRKKMNLDRDTEAWANRLPGLIIDNWKDPIRG